MDGAALLILSPPPPPPQAVNKTEREIAERRASVLMSVLDKD
jgi:hypothetical protein